VLGYKVIYYYLSYFSKSIVFPFLHEFDLNPNKSTLFNVCFVFIKKDGVCLSLVGRSIVNDVLLESPFSAELTVTYI
jgi:hypothetical protein